MSSLFSIQMRFKPRIIFLGGFPPSIARLAEYNYEVLKTMAERLVKHGVEIYVLANKADIFTNEEVIVPSNVKTLYESVYRYTNL